MTFDELNLAPAILKAVREQGYETPTPIQAQAIPAVLEGHDLLGGAQTGTGKTAAFTLPMLHKLTMSRSATNKFGGTGTRVLVLTPTRELAAQVEESVRTYGKYLQLTSTVIFGGVGMNPQINKLKHGVDILVATPGRLLDLQQQGFLDLSTVQMLVLDEADRMLDMGFLPDVKKILALVPKEKQSLLFSATFSDEIRALVATDIAARGIDIDELPHVVNYEIPNVSEDYVHRIGRTGRAGNDGAAVSLVCLDEEGFMRDIERFTRQDIEVKVIEGFGPEQGEQAEPIAMGRQTIWGGIGKPPSREVMAAAAKAARTEMLQRVRDNKADNGGGRNGNAGRAGGDRTSRAPQPQGQRSANGNGNGNGARNAGNSGNGNGGRNGNGGGGTGARQGVRPAQPRPAQNHAPQQDNEMQPRDGAHNSQSPFVQRDATPRNTDGQPDPLRTSVDSMGGRGRRGGGGGGRPNRSGGGGNGARGPGNPARTFGR